MTSRTRRIVLMRALGALLVLAWCPVGPQVRAQPAPSGPDSTAHRTGGLAGALERLAAAGEVSLVYDAALVRGHDAPCAVKGDAPEATLRCLLAGTGLDFVQTSGGTYVIKHGVRRPPKRGAIRGVVRDAGTGAPLSQVHVRVARSENGAVTDDDGRFQLSDLLKGPHTLIVSHLGYETVRTTVSVSPSGPVRPTIRLSSASVTADPVVVDAAHVRERPARREHASLPADQLVQSSPVGTPSVTHAAGSLIGITTQAPYADLHVQGGASNEHEVRLDGVPVRNPATAGRLLGAFSPLALDGLTARKAGFDGLRGNALSGLIELEHDLQRDDAQYATVRADPVSINGRADGTVTTGETRATVMGAARIGVWDVHQSRVLSRLFDTWSALDPVLTAAQLAADSSLAGGTFRDRRARPRSRFHDVHGAAHLALGPTRHLYVSGYHGRSTLGTDLVAESSTGLTAQPDHGGQASKGLSVPASDRYAWTNTVAQARYESRLSESATGTLQAHLSRYRATSDYETGLLRNAVLENDGRSFQSGTPLGSRSVNGVTEVGLDGTLDLVLSDQTELTLTGGWTTLDTQVRLANAFAGVFRHADRTTRFTAAGQAEVGIGSFTTFTGSVRLTGRPERRAVHAEPRAALRYHRPRTSVGEVAVRVGGGVYRRYTTQFELSRDGATAVVPTAQVWMPVPKHLTPPRTYHLATDATWAPMSAWSVGVEGYVKWQPHLLAIDYPALRRGAGSRSPTQMLSSSQGRTLGVGVHVSYQGRRGSGTLRYAYIDARRTFPGRFDERQMPPPWNEPHRVTLTGRVPLGGGVALTLRGTGVWGRSWGYRRAYYAYLQPDDLPPNGPDLTRPADHALPPLYRADAGLVATHHWGNVAVTGRIGLVNLLGRANVADWGLRPTGPNAVSRRPRTLPGRRSVVSLQIRY